MEQVRALDQVHHQGQQLALDHQVADPDDVRVAEPHQDGALPQEAHHDVRVGRQLLAQHLDRDQLAGLAAGHDGVLTHPGTPHGAGGPPSEGLLKQILAADWPHLSYSSPCRCRGALPAGAVSLPGPCSGHSNGVRSCFRGARTARRAGPARVVGDIPQGLSPRALPGRPPGVPRAAPAGTARGRDGRPARRLT